MTHAETIAEVKLSLSILSSEDPHVIGYGSAKDKIIGNLPALLDRLEKLEEVAKVARVVLVHWNGPYDMRTDINQSIREREALSDAIARLDGGK